MAAATAVRIDRRELCARTRPEQPRDQRDERAEAEREEGRARGGPRGSERTGIDPELVAGVRFERRLGVAHHLGRDIRAVSGSTPRAM